MKKQFHQLESTYRVVSSKEAERMLQKELCIVHSLQIVKIDREELRFAESVDLRGDERFYISG